MGLHILIDKANRYPEPVLVPIPEGCTYVEDQGYWIIDSTNEVLMLSQDPPKVSTKKWDRETGEDQKGE